MKIKDVVKINELNINSKYPYSEIEYIDTASLTEGRFEKIQHIQLKDAPSRAKRIVRHNDILISTVRPNLKHYGIAKNPSSKTVASTGFAVITCKKICPDYLYHLLTTNWYTDFLSGIAESQQSNYPAFNPSLIENTTIDLPELPIQRKIAAVLSTYHDLIENNNRRIAILEKIAEELYREWFVRLRFPGHEKVKIVKGVPDGWEPKRLKEVVDRKSFRKIYRESELQPDGRIIVIDQSVNEYLGFYDGEPEHRASENRPIMLFGDHSCKMQIMIEPFSLAENVIPFVAKGKMPTAFLFYLIHNSIETTEYKRHWSELVNKEVYIPKEHLQSEFARIVISNIHQKEKLISINRRIKIVRDRLLSRLMSGKIDVENLDIQFPDSMKEEAAANA